MFSAATLWIEHPGGFRNALWRTTYRVDVYDDQGRGLGSVRERDEPGALSVVRATGFSRHTPFNLRVADDGDHELLGIRKGLSGRAVRVEVLGPAGTGLGSLHHQGGRNITVDGPDGQPLGALNELAALSVGTLAKRSGRKVRRDVLRLHPDLGSPARELAIAAALAFDIVCNKGTTPPSGWSWPAG